jgi:hypothetical protein
MTRSSEGPGREKTRSPCSSPPLFSRVVLARRGLTPKTRSMRRMPRVWASAWSGFRLREQIRPKQRLKLRGGWPHRGNRSSRARFGSGAHACARIRNRRRRRAPWIAQARVLASGFHRLAFAAAKTEAAVLVLNQIRGGACVDGFETTAGGPSIKLHAALRIALEPLKSGSGARFRVIKSGLTAAVREGEIRFESDREPSASP